MQNTQAKSTKSTISPKRKHIGQNIYIPSDEKQQIYIRHDQNASRKLHLANAAVGPNDSAKHFSAWVRQFTTMHALPGGAQTVAR